MAEVFANRPESVLASGILAGATSFTVATGEGAKFSPAGDFSILLQDASVPTTFELVKCTARTGDTLTITATANAWDVGDKVVQVLDKRVMGQIVADIAAKQALSDYDAHAPTAGNLAASVTLTANTSVEILQTASLAVGTWLITAGLSWQSATVGTQLEFGLEAVTATATFTGQQSCLDTETVANSSREISVSCIAVITVAGTLRMRGYSNTNASTARGGNGPGGALPKVTGYTAVKIA